ncbi:hypothetical protein BGW42_005761 [Actinomortierella wolfii]|nr:hypothetical protein BGW42_005761 [Actinomortierella wolfii]
MRSSFITDTTSAITSVPTSLVPADLHRFTSPLDTNVNSPDRLFGNEENEELEEDLDERHEAQMQVDHERRFRKRHDSGMELDEAEARELARQQLEEEMTADAASPLSTVKEEEMQETEFTAAEDDEPAQPPMTRSRANIKSSKSALSKNAAKTKTATAAASASVGNKSKSSTASKPIKTINAGKSSTKSSSAKPSSTNKGSNTGGKGSQAKKQPIEEESPEVKRQRFLERNRLAASKCREKKRLQTLKTIADADAITLRNQELHEQLNDLQEQVRSLKTQILCHRDCGCDVIQKFVRSSFEHGMPSSSSSAMMQPHHQHPTFHVSSHAPYHQTTLSSAIMSTTSPFPHM